MGKEVHILMRVVKEAEERKNEILDVAEKLFVTKGYDNTSTNDILECVGIARGTLYYHFKSKEDILDAMIERITLQLMGKVKHIAEDKSIPVMERLPKTIIALNVNSGIGHEVVNQVHKAQNALMHQKMQERILSGINPILTELLKEGIEEKIFSTEFPAQAVEMIMLYANVMFDDVIEQTVEEKRQRMMGFIYNTERILGSRQGTLKKVIMKIFDASYE